MKKINIISLFFIAIIALSGCVKDEMDINLTQKVDGNLKVTLTTSNGSPIVDQKVELYEYEGVLEETQTDANGVAVFNNVLMGTYQIGIRDVADGDAEYNVYQPVQVISNVTKEYQITPSDFSGSAEITVVDSWTDEPIAGINVVVFNSADLNSYSFQSAMDAALFTRVTDSNGLVKFEKLPLNSYGIMVYTTANPENYRLESHQFDIYRKDQVREFNIYYYQ